MLTPWKKSHEQPRQHIKKQRHYLANKGPSSQGYGFSSSHVWMWELKKLSCWRIDAFEPWCWRRLCLLRAPWTARRSNHPKGNQFWIFIGRTAAEAETPVLWLPDVKSWLFWKDPYAGKDWNQEETGDDRWWDGWMASLPQWTWVWVNSRSWWWTGRPGVLQFMGFQRVGHDWDTEVNWSELIWLPSGSWVVEALWQGSQEFEGFFWSM